MTAVSAMPLLAPPATAPTIARSNNPSAAASTAPARKTLPLRLAGSLVLLAGLLTSQPLLTVLGLVGLAAALALNAGQAPLKTAEPRPARAETAPAPLRDTRPARPGVTGIPSGQPCARDTASRPDRAARGKYPRLRLRPIVPLHRGLPIHSWLGGSPHMPSATPWPMAGGKPALFLAQISCAHLPPRLWDKRGPREGWLLAFTSQDNPGEPILRHIPRFGEERQPPGPLRYPSSPPMRADILARSTGKPAAIPRWPIEIVADDGLGANPLSSPSPALAGQGNPSDPAAPPDLADPRYQPFDWGSVLILVDSLQSELDWQNQVVAALVDPDRPDTNTLHFLDRLSRTHASVAALRAELCSARDQGLAFSPELRDLALRGLASLAFETSAPADGGLQIPVTTPLPENEHMRRSCLRWFDHYARRLYTDRPEDLPDPQRSLFEAHWARLAHTERGEMGGEPIAEDSTTMTVLRLPASRLMGWSFGASGDFHIALPADVLSAGALNIGGDTPCDVPACDAPADD